MENKISAVIVAAGTGKRMNSSVKKQYMEMAGSPVLYHTLKAFEQSEVDE
ncbi:MAG: 2-C-methyl-D-erythritol 4-phosphate cytidylyltransferase, partial [Lachnospiraceae bacterium]|nr:2-C-methyl-D-erythritol 4-phosphate cytidylyltransferase [Lachnospiraceae bacterium]